MFDKLSPIPSDDQAIRHLQQKQEYSRGLVTKAAKASWVWSHTGLGKLPQDTRGTRDADFLTVPVGSTLEHGPPVVLLLSIPAPPAPSAGD